MKWCGKCECFVILIFVINLTPKNDERLLTIIFWHLCALQGGQRQTHALNGTALLQHFAVRAQITVQHRKAKPLFTPDKFKKN